MRIDFEADEKKIHKIKDEYTYHFIDANAFCMYPVKKVQRFNKSIANLYTEHRHVFRFLNTLKLFVLEFFRS